MHNNTLCSFLTEVQSCLNYTYIPPVFISGNVRKLELNGKFAFLWQDTKGRACYSFDLLDKEHHSTSIASLGAALSSHFGLKVEILTNRNEYLKKVKGATVGLNKALTDAQKHDAHLEYLENKLPHHSSNNFDINEVSKPANLYNMLSIPNHYQEPIDKQKQLHNDIVNMSFYQLEYQKHGVYYICIDELPIIHKEVFSPSKRVTFQIENGLTYKDIYIPSEFMVKELFTHDVNNSIILSFIFHMVKGDLNQAMNIVLWFADSFTTLNKLPLALVLHSQDDKCMNLLYEEIIAPLFNNAYCEKIDNNSKLDKKSTSNLLDKKVINCYHNLTTHTILDTPAQEFANRLIHKNDYKLNGKIITTVANIIITSTTNYIPLISKDVPSLLINIESTFNDFCSNFNINNNHYSIAKLIENDLDNFAAILRSVNRDNLIKLCNFKFYDGTDANILDGNVDLLEVFNESIVNKDIIPFKPLEIMAPKLYKKLVADFNQDRVDRKNLIEYFTELFGEDLYSKKQYRKLISDLRELSTTSEPFGDEKAHVRDKRAYYFL